MSARAYISHCLRQLRSLYGNTDPTSENRSESGAALVEFTILMPVFFLILFGIIEFGSMIWLQSTMTTGGREGARAAAVRGGTMANATQQACQRLALSSGGQTFQITASDACTIPAGSTSGTGEVNVQISVSKASASLMNTLFSFNNGTLTASSPWGGNLGAGAVMRREGECTATQATVSCNCKTTGGVASGC